MPRRAQYDKLMRGRGQEVALLCEAQAYPLPMFRLVSKGGGGRIGLFVQDDYVCLGFEVPKTRESARGASPNIEGFLVISVGCEQMRHLHTIERLALFNLASAEPVSSEAPKVSEYAKSPTFLRASGSSFALLCPAQGFPVPQFRCKGMKMTI